MQASRQLCGVCRRHHDPSISCIPACWNCGLRHKNTCTLKCHNCVKVHGQEICTEWPETPPPLKVVEAYGLKHKTLYIFDPSTRTPQEIKPKALWQRRAPGALAKAESPPPTPQPQRRTSPPQSLPETAHQSRHMNPPLPPSPRRRLPARERSYSPPREGYSCGRLARTYVHEYEYPDRSGGYREREPYVAPLFPREETPRRSRAPSPSSRRSRSPFRPGLLPPLPLSPSPPPRREAMTPPPARRRFEQSYDRSSRVATDGYMNPDRGHGPQQRVPLWVSTIRRIRQS